MTEPMKAAYARDAAKALRDNVSATPDERQIMRDVIAMDDHALAILFSAFLAFRALV